MCVSSVNNHALKDVALRADRITRCILMSPNFSEMIVMATFRHESIINKVIVFGSQSKLFESKYHNIHHSGPVSAYDPNMPIHHDHMYVIIYHNKLYTLYSLDPNSRRLIRDDSLQVRQIFDHVTGRDQIEITSKHRDILSRFIHRTNVLTGARLCTSTCSH